MNAGFTLVHDEDWKIYPGLGQEIKRVAGEENCYAVASSSEHGRWGVGFHAGRKGRDAAAKLALAVSIASGSHYEARLRATYPEFAAILDGEKPRARKSRRGQ